MTTARARKLRMDGEGSVYQERSTGDWIAAFPQPGKRPTRARRKTEAEAKAALREMRARASVGRPAKDARMTVGDLLDLWIGNGCPGRKAKRPTTITTYRTVAKGQIKPYIGKIQVGRLLPSDLDRWQADLLAAEFSASTRKLALIILASAIDYAIRDNLVGVNVARQATRPTLPRKEAAHYSADQLAALLAAADGHRWRPLLVLLTGSAMRIGEALALQLEDVTETEIRVRGTLVRITGPGLVVHEPKTENGRRDIPMSPAVAAAVSAQRTQRKRDKLAAGASWVDSGHLFTTEAGTPLDSDRVRRWFVKLVKAAGVGGTLHTLRHTSVSAMLANGVPLTVASRIAGHSSVVITSDIYGHVGEESARAAMEAAAKGLRLA